MKQLMNMSDIVLNVLENHIGETILFTHDTGKFTIKLDKVEAHHKYPTILVLISGDNIFMIDSRTIMYDSIRIVNETSKQRSEKDEYIDELTNKLSKVYSQDINLDFDSNLVGTKVTGGVVKIDYTVLAELKVKNDKFLVCEYSDSVHVFRYDELGLI